MKIRILIATFLFLLIPGLAFAGTYQQVVSGKIMPEPYSKPVYQGFEVTWTSSGDKLVDPTEQVNISVYVKNLGNDTAKFIYLSLKSYQLTNEQLIKRYEYLEELKIYEEAKANFTFNVPRSTEPITFLLVVDWTDKNGNYIFGYGFIVYVGTNLPALIDVPDFTIGEETLQIDLWNYTSDDLPDYRLAFAITKQTNVQLINCWIENDRFLICSKPYGYGYSDIEVEVYDGKFYSYDTFRINIIKPSLRVLMLPFNWEGSYDDFKRNATEMGNYFLDKIPLADCPKNFKLVIPEKKTYGNTWENWYCRHNQNMTYPNCADNGFLIKSPLQTITDCANEYSSATGESYDFVVGIVDFDLAIDVNPLPFLKDCKDFDGWSDGQGGLPSVISEITIMGITTHELGHEFGLQDQYCDCSGVWSLVRYLGTLCGPEAPHSPLNTTLGCNVTKDCWKASSDYYPYHPDCRWCRGNFDRLGGDSNNDGIWDYGNRSVMSEAMHHFDINEYSYLKTLSKLRCDKKVKMKMISNISILDINLAIDINDNVVLNYMNVTVGEPLEIPTSGDYSIVILDENNSKIYKRNFTVNFIVFSDPPFFTNFSIISDRVVFNNNMKKIELYHDNTLLFSKDITFCNFNSICEAGENYHSCSDCESYSKDNVCVPIKDDHCDFDCSEGLDPDCVDLIVEANISDIELYENDEVSISTIVNNTGPMNATFELSLSVDGFQEINKTLFLTAKSATITYFKWIGKIGYHRLFILADSKNEIAENNEVNNEVKIPVTVFLKGDATRDCKVDIFDLASVGICFAKKPIDKCTNTDLNKDGMINVIDLALVGKNFGREC